MAVAGHTCIDVRVETRDRLERLGASRKNPRIPYDFIINKIADFYEDRSESPIVAFSPEIQVDLLTKLRDTIDSMIMPTPNLEKDDE